MNMTETQIFLNESQAREFLGCRSKTTLLKYRRQGLKYYKVNNRVLFDRSQLTEFIKSFERT